MATKQAKRISEMKILELTRKHADRLRKGSHTIEAIEQYIDQDVPNADQALKLKHEIYLAHAEHLDYILNKMKAIHAGAEKLSFSAGNRLINVYPHAKIVSKHPIRIETEYKPHKSYMLEDPELFDRYLSLQELEEMQELYSSKDINKKVMQEQRAEVNEYWNNLKEQGYTLEEIGNLFYTSNTTIENGIKQVKDKTVWKYFN